jgi:hypothetical protein
LESICELIHMIYFDRITLFLPTVFSQTIQTKLTGTLGLALYRTEC